jgi:hypothetical protein
MRCTAILSFVLILLTTSAEAATYYVSTSGSDTNSGTSQNKAWKTLGKVNSSSFIAGDVIRFKRGNSWTGTLSGTLSPCSATKCSGTAALPIKIDNYGTTGGLPVIDGGGGTAVIYLENQNYWEIRNLEITNNGSSGPQRFGIEVLCNTTSFRQCQHIYIGYNDIHNIIGRQGQESDSAIFIAANIHNVIGTTDASNYWDDVVIEQNTISDSQETAIYIHQIWPGSDPECTSAGYTAGGFDCAAPDYLTALQTHNRLAPASLIDS